MRVVVIGDTHGDASMVRSAMSDWVPEHGATLAVQVGDFGFWPRWNEQFLKDCSSASEDAGCDLWFIDGNHDDHGALDHDAPVPVEVAPRVYHVPRGHLADLDDTRVLFMGGAVSLDRMWRTAGVDWFEDERPSEAQWERAASHGPVDILITHEAPAGVPLKGVPFPLPPRELAAGESHRDRLAALAEAVAPRVLLHGHWHETLRTAWQHRTGVTDVISLAHDGRPRNAWCALDMADGQVEVLHLPPDAREVTATCPGVK